MSKDARLYLLAVILLLVGIGFGFFAGTKMRPNGTTSFTEDNKSAANDLFSVQTAILRGKIDQINNKELTVTNTDKKTSGKVKISDRVIITTLGKTKPTSDISVLETGKDVLINLELVNGEYEAVSIQYANPSPSVPPLSNPKPNASASESASTK